MKALYRSRKNRVIAGVCGGIGEYFNIDPVIIRILWLVLTIFGGMSIIVYIIAWIIIPDFKTKQNLVEEWTGIKDKPSATQSREIELIVGFFILFIGLAFLLSNLGWFFWNWGYTFAVTLIAVGLMIILTRRGASVERRGKSGKQKR